MRRILLVIVLLASALCSCRTVKTATSEESLTAESVVRHYVDTTKVVTNVTVYDTIHTDVERLVTHYDTVGRIVWTEQVREVINHVTLTDSASLTDRGVTETDSATAVVTTAKSTSKSKEDEWNLFGIVSAVMLAIGIGLALRYRNRN